MRPGAARVDGGRSRISGSPVGQVDESARHGRCSLQARNREAGSRSVAWARFSGWLRCVTRGSHASVEQGLERELDRERRTRRGKPQAKRGALKRDATKDD